MELTCMDLEYSDGMYYASMESIRGFLIYFDRKYRDMNTHLKGRHLTLYS